MKRIASAISGRFAFRLDLMGDFEPLFADHLGQLVVVGDGHGFGAAD